MAQSLTDLNAFLFAQLDRLDVEGLTPEQIDSEAKRSAAIVDVADRIAGNADLQLKAAKLFAEHREAVLPYLPQIGRTKADAP